MVKGFYSQIIDVLKANDCTFVRHGKGDHEIWHSPVSGRNFTVDKGSLSRHTANAVMKQAGINKKF
ncbi:type II toxin-antitoxin system HicA family toxin [Phyllobacterium leguminum]|uniref:HicA-like toxin of HicAB toxin-antitoxin system n=1 Tax=Phyllobacterium leguminum TaxID=314237 RepID=A0A318T2S1_9HYPH|nr:type II toxin-antitoxin system HicA family toxin [Phyllobacterium leguminum]PYE86940.1 HicA-like toxin of HicAB toxin-antitoxin system [Phyllobacterium leguminum]